jgi:hypothetical protein
MGKPLDEIIKLGGECEWRIRRSPWIFKMAYMLDIISKLLLIIILILITYNIYDLHLKLNDVKDWISIFTHVIFPSN